MVADEHLTHSGLGAMCTQLLDVHEPVPMEFVAVHNRYGESGTGALLLELMGLTEDGIVAATQRVLARKG